jgi:protein-tyrosine-phosphatase
LRVRERGHPPKSILFVCTGNICSGSIADGKLPHGLSPMADWSL